jgi:hypothetical protein
MNRHNAASMGREQIKGSLAPLGISPFDFAQGRLCGLGL